MPSSAVTAPNVALNHFGLGARLDEAPPDNPARWLLDQIERYEQLPAAWTAQPRTAVAMAEFAQAQAAARAQADPQARQALQQSERRAARERYVAAVGARVQSALDSPTPFIERLVHFWSNHFAVSVDKGPVIGFAGAFEADAVRPHVLGRFEDLLLAAVRHPAMLLFLDQAQSVGPDSQAGRRSAARADGRARGLNENLAREILELHTLGVRSGYTQKDVAELARALTGFSLARPVEPGPAAEGADGFLWRPEIHEPGVRTVLGRSYPDEGERQPLAILKDLASAPATATHIATKLARHFVADDPPRHVVQRLADTFKRTGGDLAAITRTLVNTREAWVADAKFKTPWEWALSALRGVGRRELPGMQAVNLLDQLGQPTWRPGSPAGWADDAASWAAPDALVRRVEVAQRIAAQTGNPLDARELAPRLLGGRLSTRTAQEIARSESAGAALALLLVSPEFMRR